MEEMFTELAKPYWWISVVVVGIVINIVSSYFKNYVDNCFSRAFSWWRNRSVEKKAEWLRTVDWIKQSEKHLLIQSFQESRERLRAIHFLLLGCLIAVFTSFLSQVSHDERYLIILGLGMSTLCLFCSTYAFFRATDAREKLNRAIKEST